MFPFVTLANQQHSERYERLPAFSWLAEEITAPLDKNQIKDAIEAW
jgi:hypothetical protein